MPVSLCSLSDSKMHPHLNENNARAFANPRLSFLSAGLVAVRSLWAIGAERRWHAGYFSHNCKWMVFHKNNVRLCFVDTSSEMSLTVFLGLLLACGGFPLVRSTCPSQCSCFYHNLSDGSRARWVCVLISPVFNSCNAFFPHLKCDALVPFWFLPIPHPWHYIGYIFTHRRYWFIYLFVF